MKKQLLKSMLVCAMTLIASCAWAQTTWEFIGNTAVWGAEGVTLKGGAQYDENANAVATGGVTFTGTSGFVATAKGIGFNAVGSTENENISLVVPAGYKAMVSVLTSSNRTVVGSFDGDTQQFNANWASSTKEFNNADGAEDVTLYLYCDQNPGGDQQNKAPFLEKIVLMDMSNAKAFPWTASAVAMIDGTKTTIKTYGSETDVVEGSQYDVIVDKAIKFGDDYFVLNDAQLAENVFGATFTMGDAAANYEFNYEKLDNVAFYGEVEDIYTEGLRANKVENVSVLSNGGGYSSMGSSEGYVKVTFSVPADGTYDLALGMNNTNTRERGFNYAIDGADVSETFTVDAGNAYVQEIENQTLTAGEHTLTLNMTYSLTPVFDYLLITKTGEAGVVNKAISLIPGPWSVDGATFAAYAWNEEGNAWFPFVNINGTGVYATQIPDTYTGIILARIDPKGTDENPWNNVWNQTADIDFTTIADQTVFTITGWGEGEGAKSTYTTATSVEAAKSILQRFVNVAKGLEIDTTDAEALLANDEATFEQLNDAIKTLLGSLQVKAKEIVAMLEEFFAKFDNKAATALTPYFATAEEALAGGDYIAMRAATMALAAKCLEVGKSAMTKVDSYLRKMEDETINADLDAINAAIASLSDTNGILGLIPFIQQLKDDMTPAVTTYLGKVGTLISEGAAAGKDVSAVQTAYNNVLTVAISYKSGSATLVDLGYALYNLIKAVEAYNDVEGIIPDGSYYVMSANEGTLINAEGALDAKGALITFTFDKANNAYTIEGADYFSGKQWTIAEAIEGMSGYYTISTTEGFLAASATNTLEKIADGTADAAVWIILEKAYWEDIVNSTYTVAGTKNLTGTENDWDIAEANQMVLNDETGLFEKKFKRIAVNAENQPEFKVVQTNMEGENTWYPLGDGSTNWVITTEYVGGEGLYDITITFDPSDFKEIGVIADKRIVFPEDAIVYDFETAADAGENPANKNGSAANGQAFYGWENPEKTDSKRQDYKGYEWAEGSVLPEECHVWRRSDRINGNVADNGGLKCPSNKEMAVDGLNEGDKVIIIYDAENATDKEIIWAIGDGTAEGGPGTVRATATINGVEAVTGETTIASGAEIVVNSVTPAENGTGYIVFQVKKGMIIKQIAIIQEGTTTGIASVNATAEQNAAGIYNLNGQKVEKAQKGLYIINGKKMVIR